MRKNLFFIGIFLLLLACNRNNISENYLEITVSSWDSISNDRNGKDYVRLWINDNLLFSDTFHVNYVDSIKETWFDNRMTVATVPKSDLDSIKIRLRIVSLDSILFTGKHAVDTTFNYRIDNIPYMNIDYYRFLNYFRIWDPIKTPEAWWID